MMSNEHDTDLVWCLACDSNDDYLLVLPRDTYAHWAARLPVIGCGTWGEVRNTVTPDVYSEVLGLAGYGTFDAYTTYLTVQGAAPLPNATAVAAGQFEKMPHSVPDDDEPFDAQDDIPACADGDWPPSIFYLMDQELPEEFLDRFANRSMTMLNGRYSEVSAEQENEALENLANLGYRLCSEPGLAELLSPDGLETTGTDELAGDTPNIEHSPANGSARDTEDAFINGLRSLTLDDVPSLEQHFLEGLIPTLRELQHQGEATEDDAAKLVSCLHMALMSCAGEGPLRAPETNKEIKAYRRALVTGAHSFASQGDDGFTSLILRLFPTAEGELNENQGDLDAQLQGVFAWFLTAVASGYESENADMSLWSGAMDALAGWSEILAEP